MKYYIFRPDFWIIYSGALRLNTGFALLAIILKPKITDMQKLSFKILILVLLSIAYIPLFAFSHETVRSLIREDGPYETLSALFFFLGGSLLLIKFFIKGSDPGPDSHFFKRDYLMLLLGLFLLFCCGEEISWGQRIFNLRTPEYLDEINAQHELNLHNIFLFNSFDEQDKAKAGLALWITSNRLFALFCLGYFIIIPLMDALSENVRRFLDKLMFPVMPLWMAFFAALNYILAKGSEKLVTFNDIQCISEVKEYGYAFLILITGLYFITRKKVSLSR